MLKYVLTVCSTIFLVTTLLCQARIANPSRMHFVVIESTIKSPISDGVEIVFHDTSLRATLIRFELSGRSIPLLHSKSEKQENDIVPWSFHESTSSLRLYSAGLNKNTRIRLTLAISSKIAVDQIQCTALSVTNMDANQLQDLMIRIQEGYAGQ